MVLEFLRVFTLVPLHVAFALLVSFISFRMKNLVIIRIKTLIYSTYQKESDGEAEDGEEGARGEGVESPQLVTDQPKPSTPPGVGSAGWDTTGNKPARPMPPGQNMPIPMPPPPSANERTSLSQGDARLRGEMLDAWVLVDFFRMKLFL